MAAADAVTHEKRVVSAATRTDFILSAEIMVIAINEVADEGLVARAVILFVVAVLITALVYGVVGLIVKMDDAGLALAGRRTQPAHISIETDDLRQNVSIARRALGTPRPT